MSDLDTNRVTARLQEQLRKARAERDEAHEHIARWLSDHPPLSTTERVESGLTGDLATDMARYAGRLKAKVADVLTALADALEGTTANTYCAKAERHKEHCTANTCCVKELEADDA